MAPSRIQTPDPDGVLLPLLMDHHVSPLAYFNQCLAPHIQRYWSCKQLPCWGWVLHAAVEAEVESAGGWRLFQHQGRPPVPGCPYP